MIIPGIWFLSCCQAASAVDLVQDGQAQAVILEITEALQPGENLVAVRVQNVAYAGGIWKPIHLEIYEPAKGR